MIRRITTFLVLFLALGGALTAVAQHGSADDDGSFPASWHGDTWTGEIVSYDAATKTLTTTNDKKGKTETFVGKLAELFRLVDGAGETIEAGAELKPGLKVTSYYYTKGKDHFIVRIKIEDGKKKKGR